MTKRKGSITGTTSRLKLAQYRLRVFAQLIEREGPRTSIAPTEIAFFAKALESIAEGIDANQALGIKAKRGERKSRGLPKNRAGGKSICSTRRQLGLARIITFADLALSEMPTEENCETVALLVAMLKQISQGADANKTFGVAVGRGVRKSLGEQERLFARRAALAWIASAIRPPAEGGLGIPLEKAFEDAAEEFEFEVDSLKTYWGNNPEWRRPEFDRPLFSLFRRQKKD